MTVRFYSSTAAETTLVSSITSGSTLIEVASTTGFPSLTPYTLALDFEGASEELVEVTNAAGVFLTVTRAIDGTSATAHSGGARVRHVTSARDFSDSRTHENSSNNIHGLTGGDVLVGEAKVQTLSNKTLNMATGTLNRIDIFNTAPAWVTTVNGDATTPTTSLMRWHPTSATNEVATVNSEGAFIMRNKVATDAIKTNYKLRATKSNGTEDIFYVLSGGQVVSFLDSGGGNGAVGFTCVPGDDATLVPMFQGTDPTGATRRTVIWNDGTMDVASSDPARATLDILGAAGQTASHLRVLTSDSSNTLFSVDSAGAVHADGTIDTDANLVVDGTSTLSGATTMSSATVSGTLTNTNGNILYRPSQTGTGTVSFSADIQVDTAISFGQTFPSTPKVVCSVSNSPSGSSRVVVRALNITTTGFTMRFMSADGSSVTTTNVSADYIAQV